MNNETEQIFIVNTPENQLTPEVQKLSEAAISTQDIEDFSTVCRMCATVTEFVIPIFDGEGLQNNLADKIHKHLPIQVTEQDVLPRVVCYQCANTLLAWHELVQCCVQADAALRTRLAVAESSKNVSSELNMESNDIEINQNTEQDQQDKREDDSRAAEIDRNEPDAGGKPTISVREDGKKYATCAQCGKTVSYKSWRRHLRAHSGGTHSCAACGLSFGDSGNLLRHARALHARRRPHACARCPAAFTRADHLRDHERSHGAARDFVCHTCGAASKSAAALRMHARSHAPRRHACAHCPARFRRRQELRPHASVHTGERAHACPCGRAFRLRAQLAAHARVHRAQGERCAYCRAETAPADLEAHLVAAHSDALFRCDECDTHVQRKDFILHMSLHAVEYASAPRRGRARDRREGCAAPPAAAAAAAAAAPADDFSDASDVDDGFGALPASVFAAIDDSREAAAAPEPARADEAPPARPARRVRECPTCGKTYTASSSYFYHVKHAHGDSREHECDVCGKRFGTRGALAAHRSVHGEAREHACALCGKRFRARAALYIHSQTHGAAKRWSCARCGRAFRWRAQLARHEARHEAARAHACAQCGRAFAVRADLLRHARTHAPATHACAQCGATFAQPRYLRVHLQRKHAQPETTAPTTRAREIPP